MGTIPGRAAMTAVNAQKLIASHSILAPTAAAAFSNNIQGQLYAIHMCQNDKNIYCRYTLQKISVMQSALCLLI